MKSLIAKIIAIYFCLLPLQIFLAEGEVFFNALQTKLGKKKPQVKQTTKNEQLLDAVGAGDLELVQKLNQEGANINATDQDGDTALMLAIRLAEPTIGFTGKHTEIALWLIENGAKPDAKNKYGQTAFYWALSVKNDKIINALKSKVHKDKQFLDAVGAGDLEVVQKLNQEGANINATDQDGDTALVIAIRLAEPTMGLTGKHTKIALWLIENGAKTDAKDESGRTAFYWALIVNNDKIINALKLKVPVVEQQLASQRVKDDQLIIEAWNLDLPKINDLLAQKANVNFQDSNGNSILMLVINSFKIRLEKLENQGKPSKPGERKKVLQPKLVIDTAKKSLIKNVVKIIDKCIQNGAKVNAKNKKGETALDLAPQDISEVIKVLRENGAKKGDETEEAEVDKEYEEEEGGLTGGSDEGSEEEEEEPTTATSTDTAGASAVHDNNEPAPTATAV